MFGGGVIAAATATAVSVAAAARARVIVAILRLCIGAPFVVHQGWGQEQYESRIVPGRHASRFRSRGRRPLVQRIRRSLFVGRTVRLADQPATASLVEAASAAVLLEDPEPEAVGTRLDRPLEQRRADALLLDSGSMYSASSS